MDSALHLVLKEVAVAARSEWQPKSAAWLLLRISSGLGYWKHDEGGYHQLSPDDVLVVFPSAKGTFMASTVSDVQLQVIAIDLGLLCGVLTMNECRALGEFAIDNRQKVTFLPANHPFSVSYAEICREPSANAFQSRVKVLHLFSELIGEGLNISALDEPGYADGRTRLTLMVQKIPEAELMRIPEAELAKKLCCSPRHFRRLFREATGLSLREKQTKLRLERARHLLEHSSEKIINVALESGYRSLSLFNVMFKERFKMTPSQWRSRSQGGRRISNGAKLFVLTTALLSLLGVTHAAEKPLVPSADPAMTNAPSAQPSTNGGPRFRVVTYHIRGNTLLSEEVMSKVLAPHTGDTVDLPTIKKGLSNLLLAYRERGYATVGIALPQQQITNGVVNVQVNEGQLAEILVQNNRYFSSNNVLRSLPGVRTNAILNSKLFQAELDRSNANQDRQIYPQIQPGLDPGTTALILKVKDRLPLHGRLEINNYNTPGTPDLRINSSLQYNNLWQLEHAAGFQYGFSPEEYKEPQADRTYFFDRPLITYYNAFYRMPLGVLESLVDKVDRQPDRFGYNEATRQFQLPPSASVPELFLFANRSTTDSTLSQSAPQLLVETPVTTITSETAGRDFSVTESVGFRGNFPWPMKKNRLSFSLGFDLRHYEATGFHTNIFSTTSVIPPENPNDPPEIIEGRTVSGRRTKTELTYLPFVVRMDTSLLDKTGQTSFSLGAMCNLPFGSLSRDEDFQAASGSEDSSANFASFTASVVRDQKIYGDWRVLLRVEGQTATEPVFSNEQFSLGGISSVRGYQQGDLFGDGGWRCSLEPRTPAFLVGRIKTTPVYTRFSAFVDAGQTFLFDPLGRPEHSTLVGTGGGINVTIGKTFDLSATVAWPLRKSAFAEVGDTRVYFNASAQF